MDAGLLPQDKIPDKELCRAHALLVVPIWGSLETRSTIEVAHFRYFISEKTGFLDPKSSEKSDLDSYFYFL